MKFPFNLRVYPTTIENRIRQIQVPPTNFTLHARDGSFVSIIGLWISYLGIGLGKDGRSIHWLAGIGILSFITTTISQVVALIQAKNDSAKMFECFSVITFCAMGLLKLYSLRGRRERWHSLLSSASELELQQLNFEDPTNVDYESEDEEDTTFKQHIEKYTQKFISTSTLLARIYTMTCFIYIVSPFIEYAIWQNQGADILDYPHILPGWISLEKIFFPVYFFTIAAEGVAAAYCVCVHIVFDLSAVGMMIFIQGQFLLLHDYCERIAGEGQKCNLSRKRDLRAHFRISKCHCIHASLVKSVKELSSLTQNILGIYFNVATLTLCSVAVQLLSDELSTTQLLTLLQYMGACLIQLFLFCNYGDAVINESSIRLGEGPSASSWWCLSPHVRREVALLCVGMTRPCRLLAGPFHSLNLPTFIQIVRTAYSYYAVIRQKSSTT